MGRYRRLARNRRREVALVTKSNPYRSMLQAIVLALILVSLLELLVAGTVFLLKNVVGG